MATILATMMQRLFAGILRGPSIYARPGRQRVDWMDFRHFGGTEPASILSTLFGPERKVEFPARVKDLAPETPEEKWTAEQRSARDAFKRQASLLQRLRDIAEDARDFQNDHGESALFIGFPLLWLPRADLLKQGTGGRESRLLAPLAFVPVSLEVRRGGRPGAALTCLGEGADLLIPNPALGAWIEQQTGQPAADLFADDEGTDPWRELAEIIAAVAKALHLPALTATPFGPETLLSPLREVKSLPAEPAILSSALLGLFPMANLGLLRDTRWMLEHEAELAGPVRVFLKPEAMTVTSAESVPSTAGLPPVAPRPERRDFSQETLVTSADPCQATAVRHARSTEALVIHGPPGTGKSQTIANIIGDHVARGERVLFVCDKRTAIDVVKYRLDALGLGNLCGVVHDPARDRTALYRQIRDSVENLADTALAGDVTREMAALNARLGTLHAELTAAHASLQRAPGDQESFHQLAGEWLALCAEAPASPSEPRTTVAPDALRQHQTVVEEVLRRALRVEWPTSPWRNTLAIPLGDFLARSPTEWEHALAAVEAAAKDADEFLDEQLLPLDPESPLGEQAAARRELAEIFEALSSSEMPRFYARLATAGEEALASLVREKQEMAPLVEEIAVAPLDSELRAVLLDAVPLMADINMRAQAIENFLPVAGKFFGIFAFGKKSAAEKALAPLGLTVTPANLVRAQAFYKGLRARLILTRYLQTCAAPAVAAPLLDDSALHTDWRAASTGVAAAAAGRRPALRSVAGALQATLLAPEGAPHFAANLRMSADRAQTLEALEQAVEATALFRAETRQERFRRWRNNKPCTTIAKGWNAGLPTLEEAVRLAAGLRGLPAELSAHVLWHAEQSHDDVLALTSLRRAAREQELQARLKADATLQQVDTERVEVALRTLAELFAQKHQLVRAQARRRWQVQQRERLLAGTGTRLNSAGAALKQRLMMRGERSLKLRQMLATGAGTPGGDPLFDICPVWMTSPATVAQVFPREALFDVVVFDEASQCRLEEALPVLLRAKRVVVAGDPKQLPPTRFFESAHLDSAEIDAETAEELFEQQQSEIEDLLGAALNLNVQEAFLDVHYRSRDESLIGFSNDNFYGTRLQPIPGHPRNKALHAPLQIHRVAGIYDQRANRQEAEKVVELVTDLLQEAQPPSVGIACFNLPQRDLIIDLLDARAERDAVFAHRLAEARSRRGRDSFEGLFVKNLENVQGDERDVMLICTTFGPDPKGKFRRNFGALSSAGGGRRLNVLVTRARSAIHIITSIPRSEFASVPEVEPGKQPNGRLFLYAYLRYAEFLEAEFQRAQDRLENLQTSTEARCIVLPAAVSSPVAEAVGATLCTGHALGTHVHWGNDGFCVDAAIVHPSLPADVTIGVLTDFNRYAKTPDPIEWELFRSLVLTSQGWSLHRVWTPALLRDARREFAGIQAAHEAELKRQAAAAPIPLE